MASNFANNRENFKQESCLRIIIPFSIIACCLVVTWCFKKAFWMNRNRGALAVVRGGRRSRSLRSDGTPGPTVATALATSTKMIPQWLILWTHGKIQQSHTLNQGCKFEPKLKKSRLFCQTRKNSVDSNLNQVRPAPNNLSRRAPYPSYFCSHTTFWI